MLRRQTDGGSLFGVSKYHFRGSWLVTVVWAEELEPALEDGYFMCGDDNQNSLSTEFTASAGKHTCRSIGWGRNRLRTNSRIHPTYYVTTLSCCLPRLLFVLHIVPRALETDPRYYLLLLLLLCCLGYLYARVHVLLPNPPDSQQEGKCPACLLLPTSSSSRSSVVAYAISLTFLLQGLTLR